ncbi:hypothetical protein [Allorhizocola rhizosphaerae]|uniref:hypothetical protein n=1 Tax=Allorhizocola rhizosphaerae TaxID=1872709 RepID=UPI0013C34B98|nr:hypothetical protein [Allorhizocola rhizosphaerae]
MENASTTDNPTWPPLLDVTRRPMVELLANGDTALARCTNRLIRSLDDPDGVISAFQNYAFQNLAS